MTSLSSLFLVTGRNIALVTSFLMLSFGEYDRALVWAVLFVGLQMWCYADEYDD
jgi:hypothetical protein